MSSVIERAKKRVGEGKRAKAAGLRVKEAQVDSLPQGLNGFVTDAAARGATNLLDSLVNYDPSQLVAADRVAGLMRDGGFVVLPSTLLNTRINDATIIPMTDNAINAVATLPDSPAIIGSFSHSGHDDTTPPDVRVMLEGLLEMPEGELPRIPYQKIVVGPPVRSGGASITSYTNFDQTVYYIPPGSHRNIVDGEFRGSAEKVSSTILEAVAGAIGRELVGRQVGQPVGPVFREKAIVASRGVRARGLDEKIAQDERRGEVEGQYAERLATEQGLAAEIIEPVLADMAAMSERVFFQRRKLTQ